MLKLTRVMIFLLLLLAGCTNEEKGILNQSPYSTLTDSIEAQPENDALYFRRAVLLNKNNYAAEALQDFQTAWSIKQKEVYALGISSLLLDKHPDSVITFLNTAIKTIPTDLLQISLARALIEKGQLPQAMLTYNSILQRNPQQLNVLMMQIDLFKKMNDSIHLLPALERAHVLDPSNKDLSYNLAYQYADRKSAKAIPLADSLISLHDEENLAEAFYIKGYYYAGIKEYGKALNWLDQTIQHDHRHLNAFIEKGKILLMQKKISAAQQTFELANRISPAFPDAYYWIGRCMESNGMKDDAKLNYEKAYSLDKSFIEAKDAAAKLDKKE